MNEKVNGFIFFKSNYFEIDDEDMDAKDDCGVNTCCGVEEEDDDIDGDKEADAVCCGRPTVAAWLLNCV